MKNLINYVPSAKVCSFIMLILCLWQIYVFYHIGFSRGEAHAIENMIIKQHSQDSKPASCNTPIIDKSLQNILRQPCQVYAKEGK